MTHIVDRFVIAAWPNWPESPSLPAGEFRVSKDVARMIDWHAGEHNWSRRPTESGLFGKPIVEDPTLPVGTVYFKPGKST